MDWMAEGVVVLVSTWNWTIRSIKNKIKQSLVHSKSSASPRSMMTVQEEPERCRKRFVEQMSFKSEVKFRGSDSGSSLEMC